MYELVVSPYHDQTRHQHRQGRCIDHDDSRAKERESAYPHDTNSKFDLTDAIFSGTDTAGAVYTSWPSNPYPVISSNLLDPFDSLCENPERLRQLLRSRANPSYCPLSTETIS